MPSPFPGMDPYTEARREWPDFHNSLAEVVRANLNLALQANYYATTVMEIWPIQLADRLPRLPIPLIAPDADVVLDLGAVVRDVYERGAYARRIDYAQPVPPPELTPEE